MRVTQPSSLLQLWGGKILGPLAAALIASSGVAASTPTAGLAAGTYDRAMTQAAAFTSPSGCPMYYTTDGSTPTSGSTLYTGAIPIDETTTIKLLATGGGFTDSPIASFTYTIIAPQLYIPGNGFNTGTSIVDCSGYAKTVTVSGNTQFSTAQSKFGGSSIAFDGVGDFFSIASSADFGYGTGDFIIAFWVRPTAYPGNPITQDWWEQRTSDPQVVPTIYYLNGNVHYYTNGANRITATAPSLNTWTFVQLIRRSGTTKLYFNGVQVGSSYTDANNYITSPVYIGAYFTGAAPFTGQMSHLASFKGTGLTDAEALAWYNANVAFAPHPNALYHFDGADGSTTLTDSSNRAQNLTANGNAQLDTAWSAYGTASLLMDGNGDYGIQGAAASAFAMGSADYVFSCVVKKSGNGVSNYDTLATVDATNGSGSNGWAYEMSSGRGFGLVFGGSFTAFSASDPNTGNATWYKWSRIAGTLKAFRSTDGVTYTEIYSASDTRVYVAGAAFSIGAFSNASYPFNGAVDEFYYVNGIGDHSLVVRNRAYIA